MPGHDGTGPNGYGALTGKGLGLCGAQSSNLAYARAPRPHRLSMSRAVGQAANRFTANDFGPKTEVRVVPVKVVVSALGPTVDDLVDERFGRGIAPPLGSASRAPRAPADLCRPPVPA